MTSLNIVGQGAEATRYYISTKENAPAGTEALKINQLNKTIAFKNDLLNSLKRPPNESSVVDIDSIVEPLADISETPTKDLIQKDDTDELIAPKKPPVATALRYQLHTSDELCKLPTIEWRIKNVLPSSGIAVMFGPSGSGKSFLVLDMLQSLALGRDWFGHKVKPCSVTYVALEGEAGVAGRIKAYVARFGSSSPNIRYLTDQFQLLEADDINDLTKAIQNKGTADVVVLDTLSRATPGLDENDSKAMGLIIASAKILQGEIGGLLLLIHHTGKDASKGMRGHSSLNAALDCAIEVRRNGDRRDWVIAKNKDGEDGASHSFKLDIVSLGHDSDGDEITSCVVVPNQSAQSVGKKMPKLASNQTIAYRALVKLLCAAVDVDEDALPGKPSVRYDDAIATVAPLMPNSPKHHKVRAKEAITGLLNKGLLVEEGEWLTLNQSPLD